MIYFDMDGVLAMYDRNAYEGEAPLFLDTNRHYFLSCKPDKNIFKEFKELYFMHTGLVKVLTSVSKPADIRAHQTLDKMQWIHKYFSEFDITQDIICVPSNKRKHVEFMTGRKLCKEDILIDDYNENLYDWRSNGGTAIKYINGVNSPDSWKGLKLYWNDQDKLHKDIEEIIYTLC